MNGSKFAKNFNSRQNNQKTSYAIEIFVNSRFQSDFEEIWIAVKLFQNLHFGKNKFRIVSIFLKILEIFLF